MFVENVEFENLVDAPPEFERWSMRVVVHGDGFETRAIPIAMKVGEQNVELIVPWFTETGVGGIQGFLVARPEEGDVVSIGYADGPLFPTEFAFSDDGIIV